MIKITYDMHSHQKWAFGETKNVERREFFGKDEFDIMRQQDEIIDIWYQDSAVKSIWFEEISRENLEEKDGRLQYNLRGLPGGVLFNLERNDSMQKDFDLGEYFLKQIKEKETGNESDFLKKKRLLFISSTINYLKTIVVKMPEKEYISEYTEYSLYEEFGEHYYEGYADALNLETEYIGIDEFNYEDYKDFLEEVDEFDFLETKKTFDSGNKLLIHKYGLNDNKLLSLDIPVLNSTIIVKFPENKIVYRIMNEYAEDSDIMKKAFIEGYLVSSKHYSGQEVTFENINIAKEDKDYEELKRLLAIVDLHDELEVLKD